MPNVVEIILTGKDLTELSFKKSIKTLDDLKHATTDVTIGLAAAATSLVAMTTVMVEMTAHAIESADALGKNAQKAGITVDDFSRLAFAGGLVNVSQEQLVKSMKGLSDFMGKQGLANEDLRATLLDVADQFADMPDGIAKTNRAVELFGKTGQELIPLLNQGSAALREQFDEAEKLGVAFGSDLSNNAADFNDNLHKLKEAAHGLGFQLAEELLPDLIRISETLLEMVKEGNGIKTFISESADQFKILARAIEWATGAGGKFREVFPSRESAQRGGLGRGLDLPPDFFDKLHELQNQPKAPEIEIINPADVEKAADLMDQMQAAVLQGLDKIQADVTNHYSQRLKTIEEFKISAMDKEELISAANKERLVKEQEQTDEFVAKKRQLDSQLFAETLQGYAQQKFLADEQYFQRIDQIKKLGLEEMEEQRLILAAEAAHLAAKRQLNLNSLHDISGIFGNLAAAAMAFGAKGFAAYKAFASAQALINTYSSAVAAYNALAGIPIVGPALAVAAAAAAIAAGLANVAAINSAQPTGAAHGGIDFVPDERTFLLSRGERVLQPAANQDLTQFLENSGTGGDGAPISVGISLDGAELGRVISRLSRDGRLEIHMGSLVT